MRLSISLLALLAASPVLADDILLRADIAEAVVYDGPAEITRRAALDIPEGRHRLLIAVPDARNVRLPQVAAEGVMLGPVSVQRGVPVAEGALDTPEQAGARARVEAARDALQEARDRLELADTAIRAREVQIAYLDALATGEGAEMPDAAELSARLATLGAEMARVAAELQEARVDRRATAEEVEDAEEALRTAEFELAQLFPFGGAVDVLAVEVTAETATSTDLTLTHQSNGVSWQPRYDLRLDSETGALAVTRAIALSVPQGEPWHDVAVVFSADNPNRAREPRLPQPDPARIIDPAQDRPMPLLREAEEAAVAAPMGGSLALMEPVVAADVTRRGLAVSYSYLRPVSVDASGSVLLEFDSLAFEADLTNLAVPRHNATAFLMAEFENDSGEPILPGAARFFRDGALIGEGFLPMLPEGAEAEMAFGPLDHIRLDWRELSLDEGDRGFFTTSSTQERRVRFSVENTSGEAEEVLILYATPFAEQEDLEVAVEVSIAPDETGWDDMRGVYAWEMDIAPGTDTVFDMSFGFDWPEGQRLNWQP